ERVLGREVAVEVGYLVNRLGVGVVGVDGGVVREALGYLNRTRVIERVCSRFVVIVLEAKRVDEVAGLPRRARGADEGRSSGERRRANRAGDLVFVDVVGAGDVGSPAEQVADFDAVPGAEVTLDCQAGLLGHRIVVVRSEAETDLE